ncbi:MAG: cytochrome c3 family protein [Chloroflexi bacterium]|nr:cytochrome c3 family protein [Chloroflexota bacterium]
MQTLMFSKAWIGFASLVFLIVFAVACASPTPKPTPTLSLLERLERLPTATPRTPQTIEQVMQGWQTSRYLDNKHLSKGMACATCHTPSPPPNPPTSAACLTCHKGSYTALAEVTQRINPNPHKSHLGEAECADCHRGHRPFEYACKTCHNEYSNSRYE